MAAVNALLTLLLLALCIHEWRSARRLTRAADRLEHADRAITDPTLRRAVADDFHRRYLRGAR